MPLLLLFRLRLSSKPYGLYFVGLKFLHSVSSEQIHGVGRDAAYIADAIKAQRAQNRSGQPAARQEKHLKSA